jgi:hypothetical protein
MAYRNKTYVAFASEDIHAYRLMGAWKEHQHIDFDFIDAHNLNTARDTSDPATIKRRLRERLANTKQVVLLGSSHARRKGGDGRSFLSYEVEVILDLNLPIVISHLDGSRGAIESNVPVPIYDSVLYSMSVTFQPKIIKYALDHYVEAFPSTTKTGPYHYKDSVYESLGL